MFNNDHIRRKLVWFCSFFTSSCLLESSCSIQFADHFIYSENMPGPCCCAVGCNCRPNWSCKPNQPKESQSKGDINPTAVKSNLHPYLSPFDRFGKTFWWLPPSLKKIHLCIDNYGLKINCMLQSWQSVS